MKNKYKTKEQLLKEIDFLKIEITKLRKTETKRKQVDEKLKESEEKFVKAFHDNPIPIYITTIPDGVFIDVNPMVEKLSGFKRSEIIGKTSLELNFYEKPEDRDKLFNQLQKDGKLYDYEISFRVKSGESRHCRVFSEIIEIQGKPLLLSMILDGTEHKIAEESMIKTMSLLQATLESTADGILVVDLQGKIVDYNEKFMEIWEMPENMIPEGKTKDLVSPENTEYAMKHIIGKLINPEKFIAKVQELYSKPEDESFDILKFKDGRVIERYSKPQYLNDNPIGRVWSFRDVTERKQAEEALLESENKYRILYEGSIVGVGLIKDGVFIDCNKQLSRLLGYERNDIIGQTPVDHSPETQPDGRNSREVALERIEAALAGVPQQFIWKHKRKDGVLIDTEVFLNVVTIGGKKLVQAIMHDITERKQVERALAESEKQIKALINTTSDLAMLIDMNGKIITTNNAMANIFGQTPDKMINKNIYDMLPPNLVKQRKEQGEKAAKLGTVVRFIDRRNDRWLDNSVYPIFGEEGKLLQYAIFSHDITERKQAEKVLRESEDKYRAIFESLQDVYYRTDIEGRITIISPSVRTQAGYEPEDIIGRKVTDFYLNPSDRAIFSEKLEKFGIINDYELHIKAKDGRVIDVSISSKIIYGENGNPIGIEGLLRDITERKQTEKALLIEKKFSENLLETANTIILTLDVNANITSFNKFSEKLTGYKKEEVLGKNWFDLFIPKQNGADIPKIFSDVLEGMPKVSTHENLILCKNGSEKLISWKNTVLEDKNRDLSGVLSIGIDITERKQAEDELKTSEERLKILFESAPDAYYLNDLKGNFVDANKAAEDMLGYKREEMVGQNLLKLKLISPKQIVKATKLLAKNALGKGTGPDEFILNRKDGSQVSVEIRTYPVQIKDKTVVLGIARDITERKKAENKIRESEEIVHKEHLFTDKLINSLPGIFYLYTISDNKSRLIRWNKNHEEVTGYSSLELKNMDVFAFFNKDEFPKIQKGLEEILQFGNTRVEAKLKLKNGNSIPYNFIGQLFSDTGKNYFLGVGLDITKRKKNEDALKDSEQLNKAVIDNSPFGISVRDKKGTLLLSNKAWQNLWGFSDNEITNYKKTREKLVFNEKDSYLGEHLNKVKEIYETGGEYYIQEIKLSHSKKNKAEWISQYFYSIMDDKGNVQRVVVLTEDITERKQAEESVRISEEKYSTLVENSKDGIVLIQEGLMKFVNKVSVDLLGYTQKEIIGENFPKFVKPEYHNLVLQRYKDRMEDKEIPSLYEIELIRKDGKTIPIEINAARIEMEGKPADLAFIRDITERKKAEQELINTKEKFQTIIQNLMEGFYNVAMDGAILDYNAEFVNILGLDPNEDYKGLKTPDYWIDPRDREIYIEELERNGFIRNYSINAKKQNEEKIVLQLNARLIKDENGNPERIEGTFIDITELKLAEEELRKREAQHALVLKSLPMAFYIAQPFGDYGGTWVSDQIGKISGFTAEQFINDISLWASRLHPEDRDRVLDEFDKVTERGSIKIEYRWQALDGKYLWLLDSGVLIRDKNGKPYEIIGTWLDITERKKAEDTLKNSEEQYRLLFNLLPYGGEVIDSKGKIIKCSPSTSQLLGYKTSEIIGKHITELLTPDSAQIFQKKFPVLLTGEPVIADVRMIRKDGSKLNIMRAAQPILNNDGKIESILALNIDITERKKAEKQIARDLKIKTALLQEVYHRTKNNMQVIISMLKIQSRNLENRSLTENKGIDFLHDSFSDMINKIKAMSMVHEKLYQAKDLSHINLREYIEDLVRSLMISFGIRAENVILELELEDIFVLIDSAIPIGLVLNEMISNVFKHAFPHTKNDKLSIKLHKEEDETINIDLSDNGAGIPDTIDLKKVNSMGLQTVFSLIEYQLMGKVEYDTKKGLKWHISFKDNMHKERV